ncbi:ATP-grasp domain-containing protein [Fluviispira vulneris]|uniref:ATP-grasp domain-containing protein n=1 Tax=Fluviispira vulneris TaxID=2763012 RepID=UPI0016444035|nr:ATP-grasp domain-containing protein [Fluviispira vulneris]
MYAIIVDPLSSGSEYLNELRNYAIKVISILSRRAQNSMKTSHLSDYITEGEDFSSLLQNFLDITQGEKILFCLPGSEIGVELAEKIAQNLKLKTNNKDFSKERLNKYLMQERIKHCGLNSINQFLIKKSSCEFPKFSFPVVLKPTQSAGSDGVIFCNNQQDVKKYIDKYFGKINKIGVMNNELLMQEFIAGTEFVVDLVTIDNHCELVAMWKYEKILSAEGNFIYSSLKLINAEHKYFNTLLCYAKKVIKALGICFGPAHVEIMIDKKEEPILIEVGSRPHGGKSQAIMRECFGYNQITRTLDNIFNEIKNFTYAPKKYGELVFLISQKEGRFKSFGCKEDIAKLNGFIDFFPFVSDNEYLECTKDLANIPDIVMFAHESAEVVTNSVKKLRELEKDENFYEIYS